MTPIFFYSISSSWVKMRLHTENQLPMLPGSAFKVSHKLRIGWKLGCDNFQVLCNIGSLAIPKGLFVFSYLSCS